MRIWLDDDPERDPPTTWTIARTADDAIRLLSSNETVEVISLDRDLEDQRLDPYPREITGEDVVRWMVVNKVFPKFITFTATTTTAESVWFWIYNSCRRQM